MTHNSQIYLDMLVMKKWDLKFAKIVRLIFITYRSTRSSSYITTSDLTLLNTCIMITAIKACSIETKHWWQQRKILLRG